MVRNAVLSLWTEPRAPQPPRRVWRDWLLVAVLVPTAVLEGVLRDEVRGLGAAHTVDHTAELAAAVRAVASEGVTAVAHGAGDAARLGALLRPGGRLASVVGPATSRSVATT